MSFIHPFLVNDVKRSKKISASGAQNFYPLFSFKSFFSWQCPDYVVLYSVAGSIGWLE